MPCSADEALDEAFKDSRSYSIELGGPEIRRHYDFGGSLHREDVENCVSEEEREADNCTSAPLTTK